MVVYYLSLRASRLFQFSSRRFKHFQASDMPDSDTSKIAGSPEVVSVHSDSIQDVHEIPMNVIIRPLPSQVGEEKVKSLMETLQNVCDQVEKIERECWEKGGFLETAIKNFVIVTTGDSDDDDDDHYDDDPEDVDELLAEDVNESHKVPPIDVLWIKGKEGGDYYYSFGGCHRYEAHKRLRKETISAKLVKSTITDLRCYLGNSTPDLK